MNKYLIHTRDVASDVAADFNYKCLKEKLRFLPSIQTKFCIWVSLTMLAAARIITCTMLASMQDPPMNVDPRPLTGRRRAGRPRGIGRALETLPNAQNPAI
jgi:hypothetical protein